MFFMKRLIPLERVCLQLVKLLQAHETVRKLLNDEHDLHENTAYANLVCPFTYVSRHVDGFSDSPALLLHQLNNARSTLKKRFILRCSSVRYAYVSSFFAPCLNRFFFVALCARFSRWSNKFNLNHRLYMRRVLHH